MTDINRRLQYNSTNQKQAKQAAEFLELDRQGKEIEEKGQVTNLEGISSYSRLRAASLLLENPWERTEAIQSASRACANRPSNVVLAQCVCVLPRGFSSNRETARSLLLQQIVVKVFKILSEMS